ncbi:MAG: hypothetical protein QM594_10075 [Niabella sp.]
MAIPPTTPPVYDHIAAAKPRPKPPLLDRIRGGIDPRPFVLMAIVAAVLAFWAWAILDGIPALIRWLA